MSTFKSPRRGGNIVHRLEFAPPPRARVRRLRVPAGWEHESVPRPGAAEPPAPAPPPAVAPAAEVSNRQLALLERRLEKMAQALEERDRVIALGLSKGMDDPGVASIYREVQGIHGQGSDAKRRKEFMSHIFKANLKLQESVRSGASAAE